MALIGADSPDPPAPYAREGESPGIEHDPGTVSYWESDHDTSGGEGTWHDPCIVCYLEGDHATSRRENTWQNPGTVSHW